MAYRNIRLKKIGKDGKVTFKQIFPDIKQAFIEARFWMCDSNDLKQIDIYEDDKLIASIYG